MGNLISTTVTVYALVAVMPVASLLLVQKLNEKNPVPAVIGSEGWIASLKAARYFIEEPMKVVQQGYDEYNGGVFRIPRRWRWDYIVSGNQRIKEVSSAQDDVLSAIDGGGEVIQARYTQGHELLDNPYHIATVRTSLTRNLGRIFPEVRDEIECAFDDVFALPEDDWKLIPVLPSIMKVIARTSNRLFVGLPLCRNEEYLRLNVINTIEVVERGQQLAAYPDLIKPLVAPFIVTRQKRMREMLGILGGTIEDRIAKDNALGPNYEGRPNDIISWLLELADAEGRTPDRIAGRILSLNMAAIHTTSMALTHAIFYITTYPEYLEPIREEVENVIRAEGWTKSALNSMHKLDSFVRETQRMEGNGAVTMARKVIGKDGFTFSDGINVPRGSFIYVSAKPIHYDANLHENPRVFNGFRYSQLRDEKADKHTVEEGIFNSHMITTSMEHLTFGHGKHACPGRFFAATEIKAMLAHILVNFDIKAEVPGVHPPSDEHGMVAVPNQKAGIFVRKRQL
ncbi:unnamed protein product [Mycena citricolor]|uniref:Cytochrome P450 n=1 Tax=Mycena citricolor TaxID=2018698 RepID=A0AAD2H7B3_9AGAR|nr:unnamed protein product [Mycena citricolor]